MLWEGLDGRPCDVCAAVGMAVAAEDEGSGALKMLCWVSVISTLAAAEPGILYVPSSLEMVSDLDLAYWIL